MHQTTIRQDSGLMTLINVFTVAPERQQQLVDLLTETAQERMREQLGFVSVSIHRSADGRRVVNYVQWRSRDEFEAMTRKPELQPHFARIGALAEFDPIVCEVAHVSAA
jgi:quinol monooxygenase YgiN